MEFSAYLFLHTFVVYTSERFALFRTLVGFYKNRKKVKAYATPHISSSSSSSLLTVHVHTVLMHILTIVYLGSNISITYESHSFTGLLGRIYVPNVKLREEGIISGKTALLKR
jgi:hypothetical protein